MERVYILLNIYGVLIMNEQEATGLVCVCYVS